MTEEEQRRMEEVTIAIREVICIKELLEAYRNQTIAQIILSLTDANGQPLLVPLHPDQSLPKVDTIDIIGWPLDEKERLIEQRFGYCEAQQDMIKQGWRRVILPAGKEG